MDNQRLRLIAHDPHHPGVIYTSDDPETLIAHINETVLRNQEERRRIAMWRDMQPMHVGHRATVMQ